MEKSKTDITVGEAVRKTRDRLAPLYGRGEANAMIRHLFVYLKGWDTTDLMINENLTLGEYTRGKLETFVRKLEEGEPIQYILGIARFYGMDFHVAPGVLIPRPETEELVSLIARENPGSDLRVLDIGTGSGCIAAALARNLRFPEVTALDISEEALAIARENARKLHIRNIDFIHDDIFRWRPEKDAYDIIVSNPPYIDESEKEGMERNVLEHEPPTALFVPDDNPLIFYRRIVDVATVGLKTGGKLYFEINPRRAEELKSLMESEGFTDVVLRKDMHGKERFISGRPER